MALQPQFGSLIPSSRQELLNSNYLQFNGGANQGDSTRSRALRKPYTIWILKNGWR